MNHTITKSGNDFKVDPLLQEAREAAMQKHDIDYEPVRLEFPHLKNNKTKTNL